MLFLLFVSALLIISCDALQVVIAEILPMIIRGYVCLQRQRGLVFVEKHLYQDILVVNAVPIEYELQIACHRNYLIVSPATSFHLIKVVCRQVKVIDSQQADQWQQGRIMPITLGDSRTIQLQATIRLLNNVPQQKTLSKGHFSAIGRCKAKT